MDCRSRIGLSLHDLEDNSTNLRVEKADGALAGCAPPRHHPRIGAGEAGGGASLVGSIDVPGADRYSPDVRTVSPKELELPALGGTRDQAAEPGRAPEGVDAVKG
jgi:hypothetical protein